MHIFLATFSILAICYSSLTAEAQKPSASSVFKPKVIYGDDNRADIYQLDRPELQQIADSTVAMIDNKLLKSISGNSIQIKTKDFSSEFDLCKDEPYYQQKTAASCSGFLVAENLIATAGHCMSDASDCSKYSFVFGFKMKDEKTLNDKIDAEDVYRCKKIVKQDLTSNQDYALVELDRPVRGHKALELYDPKAEVEQDIFVVGHPSGLPTKLAGGAKIRAQNEGFFSTNLDTYAGNSGSAVFDAESLKVVGILVRGENDFEYDNKKQCMRSNVCKNESCRGEDVTHISYIAEALKQSE
ncbi:MAG: trypsin-like serine peptidase [Pseudobdellovibrionaceae bacterium]